MISVFIDYQDDMHTQGESKASETIPNDFTPDILPLLNAISLFFAEDVISCSRSNSLSVPRELRLHVAGTRALELCE